MLSRAWAALGAIALVVAFAPGAALGHVVFGTTTPRALTLESDLAARVRIIDPSAALVLEEPPLRETVVVVEVLEILKGQYAERRLRFVQRGHGVVRYAKGEEVLLFVRRIAKSPELAKSRLVGHVAWFSTQETGAKFALDDDTRDDITAAVRAYAALEKLDPGVRSDALRRITVGMLASPHEVLASSALRDLVMAADVNFFSARDLPLLEPLLASQQTPIGVRIGLLAELERCRLVAGPPRWAALIRATRGTERLAAVRAAGAHPSEAVSRELLKLLAAEDHQLVATAAVSLGAPGNETAVEPLAKLLTMAEVRVRMAAIRGLGRVGSTAAKQALAKTAASHPDPVTRRRAAAEVKLLAG